MRETIRRYYPQKAKLEFRLQPFIPDYLPAVGDADAFLKVIPPDPQVQAGLGLEYLDEPALDQSDPCLLNLQLRSSSKSSGSLVSQTLGPSRPLHAPRCEDGVRDALTQARVSYAVNT